MQIICPIGLTDYEIFKTIINQGIDSRLEAFIHSQFSIKDNRLVMNFHESEFSLLLRRLSELGEKSQGETSEEISLWIKDIINELYGIEVE